MDPTKSPPAWGGSRLAATQVSPYDVRGPSMEVRIRKFTPKVVFTILFAVTLVAVADPKPREPYYISSLFVIALGEMVRIWAAGHLRKNKELAVHGPYAFVKNPLYTGTFLIGTGLCVLSKGGRTGNLVFDHLNWGLLALFILMFLLYYVPYKRRREGERLRRIFGEQWEVYDSNVPDYLPRLTPFRHPSAPRRSWSLAALFENSEHWTGMAVLALVLAITFNGPIIEWLEKLF